MTTHDPDPAPHDADGLAARLRAQPPAALPAHWRTEILAAARLAAEPPSPESRWLPAPFTAWVWPYPRAYAALAAVWLLILTLRWSTPADAPATPRRFAADVPTPEYSLALAREQLAINTVLSAPAGGSREGRP